MEWECFRFESLNLERYCFYSGCLYLDQNFINMFFFFFIIFISFCFYFFVFFFLL